MPSNSGGSQFEAGYSDRLAEPVMVKKRDFEYLDVRLYLQLRDLVQACELQVRCAPKASPGLPAAIEQSRKLMCVFEDSLGPIPEWAVSRNIGLELVEGTQLITLDGRRHGNAWLVSITEKYDPNIADRDNPYGEIKVYNVLTDAGSAVRNMSEAEVLSSWAVGDWICTRERILTRFDYDKAYEV